MIGEGETVRVNCLVVCHTILSSTISRTCMAFYVDPVELVKATPLLDSPVEWDTGKEFPSDSSDTGEEEVNLLYNVSSLTSIIDRYEGKLMRKHEMETRTKKALKRLAWWGWCPVWFCDTC